MVCFPAQSTEHGRISLPHEKPKLVLLVPNKILRRLLLGLRLQYRSCSSSLYYIFRSRDRGVTVSGVGMAIFRGRDRGVTVSGVSMAIFCGRDRGVTVSGVGRVRYRPVGPEMSSLLEQC